MKYIKKNHCTKRTAEPESSDGSDTSGVISSGWMAPCPCASCRPNQASGSKDPGMQNGRIRETGIMSSHTMRLNR